MKLPVQIANSIREVHFGGNWSVSCLKEHLEDVTWQQTTTKVHSFNTIAVLVFHMNYFVEAIMKVLDGGTLDANDKLSFAHPPINSQADWNDMLFKTWNDAEKFAGLVEQLPEEMLKEPFATGKYGSYYRNLQGVVEHIHYHLGQVVLIKKLVIEMQEK